MRHFETKTFEEMLAKKHPDFPQAIVAGWFTPEGMPTSAVTFHADKMPTDGQLLVCLAGCLAASFKKIDQICKDAPPEQREQLMNLVEMICGSLEIFKRFKSDLVKVPEYHSGSIATPANPRTISSGDNTLFSDGGAA